ncbi:MAG: GNAT family N-acetyltransferase [Nanoarchaeota archaeon]|nr:GNAT family N-acetyltransferase [Nanoarchaeota archaeon]
MAILLRKVKSSDKKYFAKWWNDPDLRKLTSGRPGPILEKRLDKYFSMMNDKDSRDFIISLNRKPIGHIALEKRKDNWYETQIIIGEKKYWGKGYGTEAIKQLIKKAKSKGISKIYLEVRPNNLRAIRAYEKCGFVGAGIKKYPKNKYLPTTLRMELILSGKTDKKLTNFLKLTQKELEKFFGIKIKPANIFLLESRKQIDSIRKEKTEPWLVGWTKGNVIFILSPEKFTKESNHKNPNGFWKTLKHEYTHIAIGKFCGHNKPRWLNEGLCCYFANQVKIQPSKKELLRVFGYYQNHDARIYALGCFWVNLLIERFGKEKFIKLLKRVSDKPDEKDFKKAFCGVYKFHYSKEDFGKLL